MKSWFHIATRTCAKKTGSCLKKRDLLSFFYETFKFAAIFALHLLYSSLESLSEIEL